MEDEMGDLGFDLDLATSVCDMTAISNILTSFSVVASNLENKLGEQSQEQLLKESAKKDKQI